MPLAESPEDAAYFSQLCARHLSSERMPAFASRTIQAGMVHNVVGSVSYACLVDSKRVERFLKNAYLRNFTSVVIRWARPYTTMLLFSNGFAVVVGAMSPEEFLYTVHLGRFELINMGYRPSLHYYSVDNTVASGHVPFTINLEDYEDENCAMKYEPILFPGAILTVYEPFSVVLIFSTGVSGDYVYVFYC
jgi:TATA-box binding protein (TBP) (component of TFIID and TFIIIB)